MKFPNWTRGKTITVTGLTVLTVAWPPGGFVLEPQAPLAQNPADVAMTAVAGATEPALFSANLTVPANLQPGKAWTFKLKTAGTGDFQSLKKSDVGDVLLLVAFTAN
jgi:hypothetical protein